MAALLAALLHLGDGNVKCNFALRVIVPDGGSPDLFVHRNALGGGAIRKGDRVSYEVTERNGRVSAGSVRVERRVA